MSGNYTSDFFGWAEHTARLIRERRWQELDADHLADEVEDLGKSERRGISSQLIRLLIHLLKWRYQPDRRSDSWQDSIADARLQILLAIEESPSLRAYPMQQLARCYEKARRNAAKQTGLAPDSLPEDCPFVIDEILGEGWLPQ
ncbi:MAG: DUF29 domain-containing protein [Chromatiaceae bacterium]|nr:DUF29 domain-containing protein [Chromatiaceae bacterium]